MLERLDDRIILVVIMSNAVTYATFEHARLRDTASFQEVYRTNHLDTERMFAFGRNAQMREEFVSQIADMFSDWRCLQQMKHTDASCERMRDMFITWLRTCAKNPEVDIAVLSCMLTETTHQAVTNLYHLYAREKKERGAASSEVYSHLAWAISMEEVARQARFVLSENCAPADKRAVVITRKLLPPVLARKDVVRKSEERARRYRERASRHRERGRRIMGAALEKETCIGMRTRSSVNPLAASVAAPRAAPLADPLAAPLAEPHRPALACADALRSRRRIALA